MPRTPKLDLGILADDLTGALDSAAPFCSATSTVLVELWGEGTADSRTNGDSDDRALGRPRRSIRSIATATRDLAEERGEPILRAALEALHAREPHEFLLKIDSQLRGHPARDVALALALAPDPRTLAIVAPAFPRRGRVTVDGIHRISDPSHTSAAAHLPALFENTGLSSAHLQLETVRSGALTTALAELRARSIRIVTADSESDADLAMLVAAGRAVGAPVLWVGTAGLATALAGPDARTPGPATAASTPTSAGPSLSTRAEPRTTLVVAGSASRQTARQLQALVDSGAAHLVVSGERSGPAFEHEVERLCALAAEYPFVTVSSGVGASGIDEHDSRWAACLAAVVSGTLSAGSRIDALVFSGGETMVETCRALGVHSLEVRAELEPGIPYSIARGAGLELPVVSKAGAFGDDRALVRAVAYLADRTEGASE